MHLSSFITHATRLRSTNASLLITSVVTLAAMLSPNTADAARVTKANSKQVVLQLDSGESLSSGQTMIVMVNGKKKALVEVTKVRGTQAVGNIKKSSGGNLVGGTAVMYAAGGSGGSKKHHSGDNPFGDLTVGGLLGYSMDSQTVNSQAMSGSGIGLKAFGDVPISGGLGAIGRAGFEQFNVSGGSLNGKTNILYLTTDLLVRYTFMQSTWSPFVAGGIGIHFPLSKSSTNALEVSKISATSVFLINGGTNYAISDTMYVTALLEYGMFPPSNSVSTHFISLRGGMGFKF